MSDATIQTFYNLENHTDYFFQIVEPNYERWRIEKSNVNFMNLINAIYGLYEWVIKRGVNDSFTAFMNQNAAVREIGAARRHGTHGTHGKPDEQNPPRLEKANAFIIDGSVIDDPNSFIDGRHEINGKPVDEAFHQVMQQLSELYGDGAGAQ